MKYHVCSVSYETTLPDAVMAERVKRVALRFSSARGYQVVDGKDDERYELRNVCAQRTGFVMVSPGLVQFFVYVFGEQETLTQAHAVEAEMGALMQVEFKDSQRLPGTLLKPLGVVKEIERVQISDDLLKTDISRPMPGEIELG